MELKAVTGNINEIDADAVVVNLFEGVTRPGGATGAVDNALDGAIARLIEAGEIKGKLGELTLIHTLGRIPARRILVAGLGKQDELTQDKIRRVAAETCRFLRGKGAGKVATIVHGAGAGDIDPGTAAQAIAEGSILGLYTFRRHITKKPENGEIEELILVERDEGKNPELEKGISIGRTMAESANFARDMVNEPANFMTPDDMADISRKMAKERGLECKTLDKEMMEELGMGGLLGVARGSKQKPKFIVLQYKGDDSSKDSLGFIGKGLTFDSGGISIKPSEGMSEMKGDMAGGAAVIAAMRGISELKPKINITALIPATENLPSGKAVKPGDVLKAMNGKTIEVANTDAEGRIILADALSYARKEGYAPLVDVATLTGACHIALGDFATGAFTNNQGLIDKVIAAGSEVGERLWQMPMYDEYKELNKSEVADIKNTGGRYGGAITAAQFLAEFAEDTPWVHLDIAGTFITSKEKGYLVKGATGVAVRTLITLAVNLAGEQVQGESK